MLLIILALIIIGLALLVIEIVFVPGTTVVGVIGVIFAGAGVIVSYRYYGSDTGLLVLGGTLVVTAIALYLSFRTNAWSRFANKSVIDSRVNEGKTDALKVGDEGTAVSTLKPVGMAQFAAGRFEVKTLVDYVDAGTKVTIVHIQGHQIIVKPLN